MTLYWRPTAVRVWTLQSNLSWSLQKRLVSDGQTARLTNRHTDMINYTSWSKHTVKTSVNVWTRFLITLYVLAFIWQSLNAFWCLFVIQTHTHCTHGTCGVLDCLLFCDQTRPNLRISLVGYHCAIEFPCGVPLFYCCKYPTTYGVRVHVCV